MQIEVASLEDILSAMKARSTPEWQNALFVPPGAYDKMKSHVDESEDTKSKERSNKLKSQADALDDTKGKKRK
jgi:Tic22-like family